MMIIILSKKSSFTLIPVARAAARKRQANTLTTPNQVDTPGKTFRSSSTTHTTIPRNSLMYGGKQTYWTTG